MESAGVWCDLPALYILGSYLGLYSFTTTIFITSPLFYIIIPQLRNNAVYETVRDISLFHCDAKTVDINSNACYLY